MNDIDAWLLFDDSEPSPLRPLLDALRGLTPGAPEEEGERGGRQSSEGLNAELARQGDPSVASVTPAASVAPVAPIASAASAASVARAPGDRQVGEGSLTLRSPSFDERSAAPPPVELLPPPVEPPPPPVAVRKPRPPEGGPPAVDLKTTSLLLDVPAELRGPMGSLPFKPRAPGTDLARTMQVPVLNRWQGQTAPLGEDSIEKAVAALPFPGSTVGAALVPVPRLSLEAYASLRAELLIWPERSATILSRYRVMNGAAHRALEESWERDLAACPEARATFDKLFAEYTAYLRTQGV